MYQYIQCSYRVLPSNGVPDTIESGSQAISGTIDIADFHSCQTAISLSISLWLSLDSSMQYLIGNLGLWSLVSWHLKKHHYNSFSTEAGMT